MPRKCTLKSLKTKTDKVLTPYIVKKHPRCLLCRRNSKVAHHHVRKSRCAALRYEEINLIPLCQRCHFVLHKNESYWASKIVVIKGVLWFKKLDTIRKNKVKFSRTFYEKVISKYTKKTKRMD